MSDINDLSEEIKNEVVKAMNKWPKFNSLHEAYSIILEEVDEVWDHVKVKQNLRETDLVRKELVQVAAMAIRSILDLEENGFRK
jgi:GTP1/Obg family GTP-binding protein